MYTSLIKRFVFGLCALFLVYQSPAQDVRIRVLATADLHANFFPHDFSRDVPNRGSLAHVLSFVEEQRAVAGQQVILLDNADLLQGQPTGYYFNFVSERTPHFIADVMNFARFDAASVGNHDVEMGYEVYNRLKHEFNFPWLAANILHLRTGLPFFEPYTILEREGVRIAVLGLVTPSVPNWLPRKLWEGLEFIGMYAAASYWMEHIQTHENPDLVIGLFHSGPGPDVPYQGDQVYLENAALYVGKYVPGFDVIFTSHDHRERNESFINSQGKEVLMIGPSPFGNSVAVADLSFSRSATGAFELKYKSGSVVSMENYAPHPGFMEQFAREMQQVHEFVGQPLGRLDNALRSREGYFGNSAFTDFIHQIQLDLTQADISFAAPLSFDATLEAGTLYMRDMFQLYPYENYLYVMELSGREIRDFLEFSYALWFNTMEGPGDHLLRFRKNNSQVVRDSRGRARFEHAFFNFDSAMGIDYIVDVTKEPGQRVRISGLSNGHPFHMDALYRVAINSYRGSGGGGHLVEGAGIEHELLESRIRWVSDKDLRSHIADYILQQQVFAPQKGTNWSVVPANWVDAARRVDYRLLFGERSE